MAKQNKNALPKGTAEETLKFLLKHSPDGTPGVVRLAQTERFSDLLFAWSIVPDNSKALVLTASDKTGESLLSALSELPDLFRTLLPTLPAGDQIGAASCAQGPLGRTPACRAAEAGNHEYLDFLAKSTPVSIRAPSHGGYTPLHFAVQGPCLKTVQTLLLHGADPLAKNDKGFTPVHEAAESSVKTLSLLLECDGVKKEFAKWSDEASAPVCLLNSWGSSPMIGAARNGMSECVLAMLAAGAPCDTPNNAGETPAIAAASSGDNKTLTVLADAGADLLAKTQKGYTVAWIGAKRSFPAIVSMAVRAGAKMQERSGGVSVVCAAVSSFDPKDIPGILPDPKKTGREETAGILQRAVSSAPDSGARIKAVLSHGFLPVSLDAGSSGIPAPDRCFSLDHLRLRRDPNEKAADPDFEDDDAVDTNGNTSFDSLLESEHESDIGLESVSPKATLPYAARLGHHEAVDVVLGLFETRQELFSKADARCAWFEGLRGLPVKSLLRLEAACRKRWPTRDGLRSASFFPGADSDIASKDDRIAVINAATLGARKSVCDAIFGPDGTRLAVEREMKALARLVLSDSKQKGSGISGFKGFLGVGDPNNLGWGMPEFIGIAASKPGSPVFEAMLSPDFAFRRQFATFSLSRLAGDFECNPKTVERVLSAALGHGPDGSFDITRWAEECGRDVFNLSLDLGASSKKSIETRLVAAKNSMSRFNRIAHAMNAASTASNNAFIEVADSFGITPANCGCEQGLFWSQVFHLADRKDKKNSALVEARRWRSQKCCETLFRRPENIRSLNDSGSIGKCVDLHTIDEAIAAGAATEGPEHSALMQIAGSLSSGLPTPSLVRRLIETPTPSGVPAAHFQTQSSDGRTRTPLFMACVSLAGKRNTQAWASFDAILAASNLDAVRSDSGDALTDALSCSNFEAADRIAAARPELLKRPAVVARAAKSDPRSLLLTSHDHDLGWHEELSCSNPGDKSALSVIDWALSNGADPWEPDTDGSDLALLAVGHKSDARGIGQILDSAPCVDRQYPFETIETLFPETAAEIEKAAGTRPLSVGLGALACVESSRRRCETVCSHLLAPGLEKAWIIVTKDGSLDAADLCPHDDVLSKITNAKLQNSLSPHSSENTAKPSI